MGWTDNIGFQDLVVPGSTAAMNGIKKLGQPGDALPGEQERIDALRDAAGSAGGFAGRGEREFGRLGREAEGARNYLRDLAQGKNSVVGEQLRQGLAQNQAQQQSVAASAAPNNAAMAARNAAMNMGRSSTAMAGQSAMARLQEQKMAQEQYAQMLMQQRQQEMQVGLGSRQNQMTGLGAGIPLQRDKSFIEKFGPMISQAAAAGATGGGKPA